MAVEIKVSFVVVDFNKKEEDNSRELEKKLNDGWTVFETFQLDFAIIYELRKVIKA